MNTVRMRGYTNIPRKSIVPGSVNARSIALFRFICPSPSSRGLPYFAAASIFFANSSAVSFPA